MGSFVNELQSGKVAGLEKEYKLKELPIYEILQRVCKELLLNELELIAFQILARKLSPSKLSFQKSIFCSKQQYQKANCSYEKLLLHFLLVAYSAKKLLCCKEVLMKFDYNFQFCVFRENDLFEKALKQF